MTLIVMRNCDVNINDLVMGIWIIIFLIPNTGILQMSCNFFQEEKRIGGLTDRLNG